jgi:hypothetical protein
MFINKSYRNLQPPEFNNVDYASRHDCYDVSETEQLCAYLVKKLYRWSLYIMPLGRLTRCVYYIDWLFALNKGKQYTNTTWYRCDDFPVSYDLEGAIVQFKTLVIYNVTNNGLISCRDVKLCDFSEKKLSIKHQDMIIIDNAISDLKKHNHIFDHHKFIKSTYPMSKESYYQNGLYLVKLAKEYKGATNK